MSTGYKHDCCPRLSTNFGVSHNCYDLVTIRTFKMASGRPIFASKTTYDLLAVDSGEESEEELVEQPDVTLEQNVERLVCRHTGRNILFYSLCALSSSEVPQKLSKSAIKKANRLTRIEKKQRQKAEKSRANGQGPASGDSVASESPSVSAPGSAINKPVELPDEVAPPTVAAHIISPLVVDTPIHTNKPTVIPNGDSHKPTVSLVAQLPVPPPRDAPTAKTSTAESMQAPKVAASIPIALHPVQPVAQPPRAPTHDIKQVALVEQKLPPQINDAERVKKRQAVLERTLWTLIMIGGFIGRYLPWVYLTDLLMSSRLATHGTCVHDSVGDGVPGFGLQRGHGTILTEIGHA